jgi:putative cardiolipin synthase
VVRLVHKEQTMARRLVVLIVLAVATAAAAHGDVFRILDDPRDAAQARVDIIQQATTDISALYFLARNDRVTLGALALLCDARRRGVGRVRLIVDANFQHIPRAVLAHLRAAGVEVRVYHPLTVRHPSWLFRRMHEKVVIADGARYITGGRNLADAYFGLAKKNYVDRDVYVDGPSAADAEQHFESLWSSPDVRALKVRVSHEEMLSAARNLADALHELECGELVALDTGRDWSDGQQQVGAVRFLSDPVVPKSAPRVADRLAEVLDGAKTSIVIESPYFVPSKAMRRLLRKKLSEGVTVLFLTNSLHSSDGVLPYAGYLKYRRRLVRAGVDVREYKGPDMLHAKSMVIDGRIALVGSYNADPRSQNLNTEVMCVTEDERVARELLDSIDGHVQNAWKVHRRSGRPLLGEHDRGVSRGQAFRLWGAKFLLPIIENQL